MLVEFIRCERTLFSVFANNNILAQYPQWWCHSVDGGWRQAKDHRVAIATPLFRGNSLGRGMSLLEEMCRRYRVSGRARLASAP
jgi:hypothetical protein